MRHTKGKVHLGQPYTHVAFPDDTLWPIRARNGSVVCIIVGTGNWLHGTGHAIPSLSRAKANALHIIRTWNAAIAKARKDAT